MKKVYIIGIGMGNVDTLTVKALNSIKRADFIIGAKRMVESFEDILGNEVLTDFSIRAEDIFEKIKDRNRDEIIAVLMSGDTGFFSGTKRLVHFLEDAGINFEIISGISSISYLASKTNISWEDAKIVSLHGRNENPIYHVMSNKKVFFLLDKNMNPTKVCEILRDNGLGDSHVIIGERLSYEDENIRWAKAEDLVFEKFDDLSVMFVIRDKIDTKFYKNIRDDEFIRGKVPMTKEEVRTVSVARLELDDDDIVYDVGAGTGSVAIEMARFVPKGKVYAIEVNKDGIELIKQNKEKFNSFNLRVVEGLAPDAFKELEPPTKVFIGGSKGNLKIIIEEILKKNEDTLFVVNAIALETLSEILKVFNELEFEYQNIIQLGASRTKKVARYTMLDATNPIFIATGRKNEKI